MSKPTEKTSLENSNLESNAQINNSSLTCTFISVVGGSLATQNEATWQNKKRYCNHKTKQNHPVVLEHAAHSHPKEPAFDLSVQETADMEELLLRKLRNSDISIAIQHISKCSNARNK